MYPRVAHVRFLEQAIVNSMRKVESEEEGAVAQDAFNNKVEAADAEALCSRQEVVAGVEVLCFRQEGKRADVVVATDLQRKTSST